MKNFFLKFVVFWASDLHLKFLKGPSVVRMLTNIEKDSFGLVMGHRERDKIKVKVKILIENNTLKKCFGKEYFQALNQ